MPIIILVMTEPYRNSQHNTQNMAVTDIRTTVIKAQVDTKAVETKNMANLIPGLFASTCLVEGHSSASSTGMFVVDSEL